MINANELRIGNLIQANGPVMIVKAITEHDVEMYLQGSEADNWDEELENCNGIEVTANILIKYGFDKMEPYDIYSNGRIGFKLTADGFNYMGNCGRGKYLHQLQNLYYALTNSEINVQECDANAAQSGNKKLSTKK